MCIIHCPSHSSALTDGQSGKPRRRFATQGIFWGLEKITSPIQALVIPSLSPWSFRSRNCRMSWWKVCCNMYIMVLKFQGYSVPHISYTFICYYKPTLQNNKKPHKLRCNKIGQASKIQTNNPNLPVMLGLSGGSKPLHQFPNCSLHIRASLANKDSFSYKYEICQFKLQEFFPFITFKCIQNTHHQRQGHINNFPLKLNRGVFVNLN